MILAGGTGGHIFPGIAVAQALQQRGAEVSWLGARGGMECQRVPLSGIELDVVDIAGLRGKGWRGWVAMPWRLTRAVAQALSIMRRRKPHSVISFGGYAAGPGGLAARMRGIPLLIHEQNRIAGLTNRVLARLSGRVIQAFPGTFADAEKVVTCGNPVRPEIAGLPSPQQRMQGRTGPVRLLVTGGSQGAQSLNNALPAALAQVLRAMPAGAPGLEILHQAGKSRASDTAARYSSAGVSAQVEEFIENMAEKLAWADLVVCRAGALTISELAAAGVGAILVPYPHAVDDHQTRNAEYLVKSGGAVLLMERDLASGVLPGVLGPLLADRTRLLDMACSARRLAVPDAAGQVATHCLEAAA